MKKLFLLLLSVSLLFTACKKDELSSLAMLIEGIVYDYQTSTVLEGVTVSVISQGKTKTATTDANGYYSLGTLPSGDYTVVFTKTGYMKTSGVVSSEDLASTANTDKVVVNSDISLRPLSESVAFTVYMYYAASDVYQVASNVDYTAYVNMYYTFTGTTDDNGLIALDSLPYATTVYFYFNFSVDDILFKGTVSLSTTSDMQEASISGYDPDGDFGVVSTNITTSYGEGISDFPISDNIVVTFTQPVDTNDFSASLINYNTYVSITTTNTWSNLNMTLTLDPDADLTSGTEYRLYLSGYNETLIQYFSDYIYFYTE